MQEYKIVFLDLKHLTDIELHIHINTNTFARLGYSLVRLCCMITQQHLLVVLYWYTPS